MNHIEAMKQALEALEVASSCVDGYYVPKGKTMLPEVENAITALRTAIEQAEKQEPVAWMKEGGFRSQVTFDWRIAKREGLTIPLYSRPQLACAPTHEPVATMTVRHTKNKTEIGYGPASKGYDLPNGEYKLYTTPPAAPVQEPVAAQCRFPAVAWAQCDVEHARMVMANPHEWKGYEVRLLYTTPPAAQRQWVGLTDEEHTQIAVDVGCMSSDWLFYGAAVERALKNKNT